MVPGPGARLARGAPDQTSPRALGPGDIKKSRRAQRQASRDRDGLVTGAVRRHRNTMATLPAFFRKTDAPAGPAKAPETTRAARPRADRDPFALRALPHEDILLF